MVSARPHISIVTPVLNGAAYLGAALDSMCAQTHEAWDCLVVDAGSADGGYELAQDYARRDERIRVVRREGEPLYPSILWGLEQAEGDWLAWLNSDDLYAPWAFAALSRYAQNQPNALWMTGLPGCWDERGVLRFVRGAAWYPQNFIRKGMFHLEALGFLQQESMFFSRALFSDLREDEKRAVADLKLAGDFLLWKTFAARAPLEVAPTVFGGFRLHRANQSVAKMATYMQEVKAAGAWTPPRPVAHLAGKTYRAAAALKTQRLVAAADARLRTEMGLL